MAKALSRDLDKFIIRLPEGMREKIAEAANEANRTMNAEIVSRLEFTFAVDVTVHETGYDVGAGLDSPEMKAALLKQGLGGKNLDMTPYTRAEIDGGFGALRTEIQELRTEIQVLKNSSSNSADNLR